MLLGNLCAMPSTRVASSTRVAFRFARGPLSFVSAILLPLLVSCGGGSSGGGTSVPTPTPSFTISLTTSTLTLTASGSQSLTVTLSPQNGFSSSATCTLNGIPSGVNASPVSITLASGSPQQFQFSENNIATDGASTVTVTCSSGSVQAQAQFALKVQVAPGIVLTSQPGSLSFYQGDQHNLSLSISGVGGVTGTVTGTVSGLPAGITVSPSSFSASVNSAAYLTFTASSTATASGAATISVTNGTISASINIPLTVTSTPDFTLSTGIYTGLGLYQSSTSTFAISNTTHNGFNQPIAVSFSGIPNGVTFSPASFTLQPGASQQVQALANFTPVPNTSPTITVTGTGGGITHTSQFSLLILQTYLNISVQPSTINIPAGSTALLEVGTNGTPNGIGSITVSAGTPPAGVTVSPASFTTPATGGAADVFLGAGTNAQAGTLTLTATFGPYTKGVLVNITIGAAQAITPVPLSTPNQLVRADALTPYPAFPYPNYVVYHASTNRFFSTDAYLNQLNVIDAATGKIKTTLDIPGAFGLDQAPDGSVLYVGTMVGDIYVIDPVNLTIIKRYPSSTISDYGFQANAVYALADGKLLLEKYFLVPGYSWVDGNGPLALWDPASNNIKILTKNPDGQIPSTPTCLSEFENAILTNNRTRVLLAPILTSEGSSLLCSLDPEAGTWNWSGNLGSGELVSFAVSPDGSVLAAFNGSTIYNLDPATLTVKNSFALSAGLIFDEFPPMFLSQDNTQVFLGSNTGDMMYAYNLATGAQTGWIPQVNQPSQGSYTPAAPLYQAMSSSGLAAGVLTGAGIGLLDTTAVHAMPVGSHFSLTRLDVPYGPEGGGTATAWLPNSVGVQPPPLGSIYFGPNPATDLANNVIGGQLAAVTPTGAPGPVDVRVFSTDGGSQFLPNGFSYGPWVIEAPTKYATAEGGGPASLYGFGFGPQAYSDGNLPTSIPSDLQVTIGGASTHVTSFNSNPYSVTSDYFSTVPMPSNAMVYTVPPGSAGTTSNVLVNNKSGTSQSGVAIGYLPATKQYSAPDQLVDGVYDSKRNVYYFTGTNQVYVFSPSSGTWLTPISIPSPKGASGPQRLYGIALSQDGSKLAISDPGAIAIYIVNPDQPASIQSFTFASLITTDPQWILPGGIAMTNSGDVYIATFNFVGDSGAVLVLHSSTGTLKGVPSSGVTILDPYTRIALSNDNSRLYTNVGGATGYYDILAGQFYYSPNVDGDIGQGSDELVLCACQTSLFADGLAKDSNLNNLGMQTLDIAQQVDAQYVYGAALSADGSLLFQPGVQFIDVVNGHTGSFRARVSLPFQLSPNFRALISNNRDSTLLAITGASGNGIAVIDLNSLPEPQPATYALSSPLSFASRAFAPASSAKVSKTVSPLARSRSFRPPSGNRRLGTLLDSLKRGRVAAPLAGTASK